MTVKESDFEASAASPVSPKKKKKKQSKNGPLTEGPPELKQKRIVINTSRSEYPIID